MDFSQVKAMSEFENASHAESQTKINKINSSDSDEDTEKRDDSNSPHVMQVRQRLERCLRHLGLTPFSTKFIIQYISVCCEYIWSLSCLILFESFSM